MNELIAVDEQLAATVDALDFALPVTHVYNPLRYAWQPHRAYLERWGGGRKRTVFLGMNPGPWGMSQTGVPFGEVNVVREWLAIEGAVERPPVEHPKRPIEGFGCARSEVSGRRLWGWFREVCGTADRFFEHNFVLNYCPLVFLEESGRNRTPDKLPVAERRALEAACDPALAASVAALEPEMVIGVGRFAERQALRALESSGVRVGRVLHPSPASPAANRGWAEQAARELADQGVSLSG